MHAHAVERDLIAPSFIEKRRGMTRAESERRYAHGTYARYVIARCRCFPCRVAKQDYAIQQKHAKLAPWKLGQNAPETIVHRETGERIRFATVTQAIMERDHRNNAARPKPENELVSTVEARAHIEILRTFGLGVVAIAQASGVSKTLIHRIAIGDVTRTRRVNESAILAVDADSARPKSVAEAEACRKMIDSILASGLYTKAWIGRQLGYREPGGRFRIASRIQRKKAAAIRGLYDRLLATDVAFEHFVNPTRPVHTSSTQISAGRARLARALAIWDMDEFATRIGRFAHVG
jgi:hypothetical protein